MNLPVFWFLQWCYYNVIFINFKYEKWTSEVDVTSLLFVAMVMDLSLIIWPNPLVIYDSASYITSHNFDVASAGLQF